MWSWASLLISVTHWKNNDRLCCWCSVTQSCPTLWPCGLQYARFPCPSPSPRACSNSCPLSQWRDCEDKWDRIILGTQKHNENQLYILFILLLASWSSTTGKLDWFGWISRVSRARSRVSQGREDIWSGARMNMWAEAERGRYRAKRKSLQSRPILWPHGL